MGNLTLNGSTSGQVTLTPPAVAGTNTITLPAATGTVLTTAGGQTISGTVTLSTLTSPAATNLTIQSAGTTAMTIDTSQNVGIGTTSPNKKLSIISGGSTQFTVSTAAGANDLIQFDTYNGSAVKGIYTWSQQGSEAMRIDSSGNVGIGTSSPATKFNVNGNASFGAAYAPPTPSSFLNQVLVNTSTVIGSHVTYTAGANTGGLLFNAYEFNNGSNYDMIANIIAMPETWTTNGNGSLLRFLSASSSSSSPTEAMRIDKNGNLLVGTTNTTPTNTSVQLKNGSITANGYAGHNGTAGSTWGNAFNIYWTGSAAQLWIDSSNVGNISLTSDYRIKKNVETQTTSALNRISQLRPVTYTYTDNEQFSWKSDGVQREGFIAHELQEVIPSAVNGEKDAENQVQSLQLDALCSVLVKAIQELKAELDALKGTK